MLNRVLKKKLLLVIFIIKTKKNTNKNHIALQLQKNTEVKTEQRQ
jgi:hypothetical protein